MSSVSLYNKWRPRTFADPDDHPLVGQEPIARTLRNAVAGGQISHAYLFCGPRGTGKTSAARILARAVNCRRGLTGEPCNQCENCQALLSGRQLDLLVEIDAASNRGVDDVRALRERIMQRPGGADLTGRFKVYIVDEVHMLTTEAFNALLKSLEEPPPHVIFVLATTDPQKVLPTVVSRCQRFDFRPAPLATLAGHLAHVAKAERAAAEPAALEILARAAAGGLRDAISLLDQALAYAGAHSAVGAAAAGAAAPRIGVLITAAQVQAMLGLTDFDAVCRVVDAIAGRDLPGALRLVTEVASRGADLRQFARQVLDFLRNVMLVQSDAATLLRVDDETRELTEARARLLSLADTVRFIKLFSVAEQGLKASPTQPQLPLELALVEAILAPAQVVAPASTQPAIPATPPAPTPAHPVTAPVVAPPRAAPAPSETRQPVAVDERRTALVPDTTDAPSQTSLTPGVVTSGVPVHSGATAPLSSRSFREPIQGMGSGGEATAAPSSPPPVSLEQVHRRWQTVQAGIRQHSKSMEALFRDAQFVKPVAVEGDNVVVLQFRFAAHLNKVLDVSNQIAVQKALSRAIGVPCKVRCVVADGAEARLERTRLPAGLDDPVVMKAVRIWGAQVLQPEDEAAVAALPEVPLEAVLDAAGEIDGAPKE